MNKEEQVKTILKFFLGFLAGFIFYAFTLGNVLRSENPIKPYKQLTIKNNKVDTLYIYIKE